MNTGFFVKGGRLSAVVGIGLAQPPGSEVEDKGDKGVRQRGQSFDLSVFWLHGAGVLHIGCVMPRKPRVEYPGAVYHIMSRGNRQETIFTDDKDCELWLDILDEACTKTGWLVHAFVLMGNHYHLLLETPEANLVAGMKWLQGTYTQRFNSRHKQWGHLLQGRYKSLLVDGSGDYFLTASNYVHLNPARAKGIELEDGQLASYRWSSFSLYLDPALRPDWLVVNRTLGAMGLVDNGAGLIHYEAALQKRVVEIQHAENPWEADAQWAKIRRGWYLGDEHFRREMLERLDEVIDCSGRRDSFSGSESREHDQLEAERLMKEGADLLGIDLSELAGMRKNALEKQALAWILRQRTIVSNQWISEQLSCGHPSNVSNFVRLVREANDGVLYEFRETLKSKD
jgi:REP element-mobilizing transposase RayT